MNHPTISEIVARRMSLRDALNHPSFKQVIVSRSNEIAVYLHCSDSPSHQFRAATGNVSRESDQEALRIHGYGIVTPSRN